MGKRYEWIALGSEKMRAARKAKGLSLEATARLLGVSTKTYWRYETDGKVPRHEVPKVATTLGLEIEMPESTAMRIILPEEPLSDVAALSAQLDELRKGIQEIREALGIGEESQAPPEPPRAANGHD